MNNDNLPSFGTSSKRILLSGSSGMLGAAVAAALRQAGFSILKLLRNPPQGSDELRWDPQKRFIDRDLEGLEGLSGAIHLSGANVAAKRWTAAYKREIGESRIQTTSFLAESLARLKVPPPALLSASATGFYGNRGDTILDENSDAGQGFFPELCSAWEEAARPAEGAGIRVVHPRFGVVLGAKGGAMERLRPLFRLGLGGKLGTGRQWMSWVGEADLVAALLFALQNSALSGPMNVTAPNPVTNAEFTDQLAHAVHRMALLPAPAFALKLAFGEMADETLLASTRVLPRKLLDAGFVFHYPTLAEALRAVV